MPRPRPPPLPLPLPLPLPTVVTADSTDEATMPQPMLDAIVVPPNGRPGRPRTRPDVGYSSGKD